MRHLSLSRLFTVGLWPSTDLLTNYLLTYLLTVAERGQRADRNEASRKLLVYLQFTSLSILLSKSSRDKDADQEGRAEEEDAGQVRARVLRPEAHRPARAQGVRRCAACAAAAHRHRSHAPGWHGASGHGIFTGRVSNVDKASGYFTVSYEDGDDEVRLGVGRVGVS